MKFTVFTATYNRASTLHRVYESLLNQNFLDFEWIIVDDGSTDNTERLINNWINDGILKIRYFRVENGGKHRAINIGVSHAQGELFLIVDSDDSCKSDTLFEFNKVWDSLSDIQKSEVSTISALCESEDGKIHGNLYPQTCYLVSSPQEQLEQRQSGERFGVNTTKSLKEFPFPEYLGEKFLPEVIVWNRMSLKYSAVYINKSLRVFSPREDGLTMNITKHRQNNPLGTKLCYWEGYLYPAGLKNKIKSLINYHRFCDFDKKNIEIKSHFVMLDLICRPLGRLMLLRDTYLR